MESLIALFEQDTELAYWQLRQRSEQADMSQSEFHEQFIEAIRNGLIETDPQSNCKLMCDSEPPQPPIKTYKTDIKEGVKCPNRLCEAVIADMKLLNSYAPAVEFSLKEWETELRKSIVENHAIYPRCAMPHISKWFNQKDTWFLGVSASEAVHCRSGSDFLTISVEEMEG